MTTTQILWRLTWKEYRAQRALWWAVLVLTLIVEGLTGLVCDLLGSQPLTASGHLVFLFGAVGVYLLGCGATLFALEHEQGTFEFQRLLPSAFGDVFVAKLSVGYLSGLALGCVLLVPAMLFPVSVFRETTPEDWRAGCVTCTEIFLWSVFFSLLLRDPLRAAVCGIAGASIMACALFPAFNDQPWSQDVLAYHRGSLGPRSLAALVLLLVNVGLARRWFQGGALTNWLPSPSDWFQKESDLVLRPATGKIPRYLYGAQTGFGRLVGIAWRQGKWLWIASVALFAVALMAAIKDPENVQPVTIVWLYSLVLSSWCSFGLDQRGNQFRFYAERGVSPRWLWFSRQVLWFTPVLLMAMALQLLPWTFGLSTPDRLTAFMQQIGMVVFTVMAYSIGQLWAMAIRRALLAFVFIIFSNLFLFLWLVLMVLGEVPWWLSMLPIPVVCLYATWRFAGNWIEERHGKRYRRQVIAVFGLPAAIVLLAIAAHRAYSIPAIPPPVAIAEYTRPLTPEERETLDLYTQAQRELVAETMAGAGRVLTSSSSGVQSQASSHHARIIELLRKAHERPRVPVTMTPWFVGDQPKNALGNFDAWPMVEQVDREALHLTGQGKLAEAWQAYEMALELVERIRLRGGPASLVRADGWETKLLQGVVEWANHRDQTPALLATAQRRLADWDRADQAGLDTVSRIVKVDYVLWSMFRDGDLTAAAELGLRPTEASVMRACMWVMPWEVIRSQRVSDLVTSFALHGPWDQSRQDELYRLSDSTLPLATRGVGRAGIRPYVGVETDRRATQLLLALIVWRRGHGGKLPERLQELREAGSTVELVYPATQRPFIYSAQGAPDDVPDLNQENVLLPKNTPFLWSPGYSQAYIEETAAGQFAVRLEAGVNSVSDPSFQRVVAQGTLWVVPPYQPPSPHP